MSSTKRTRSKPAVKEMPEPRATPTEPDDAARKEALASVWRIELPGVNDVAYLTHAHAQDQRSNGKFWYTAKGPFPGFVIRDRDFQRAVNVTAKALWLGASR